MPHRLFGIRPADAIPAHSFPKYVADFGLDQIGSQQLQFALDVQCGQTIRLIE
jgi:hypothetical protein